MKKNILLLLPYFLVLPAIADDNNKEVHIGNTVTKEKILEVWSRSVFTLPPEEDEENSSESSNKEEATKVLCHTLPKISMSVNFPFNSSYLTRNELQKAYAFAEVLGDPRWKHCIVTVEGHTDSKGKKIYNKRLSKKRAQNVSNQLYQRGVDIKRLKVVGYGEEYLFDLLHPESAINRRVAFRLSGK